MPYETSAPAGRAWAKRQRLYAFTLSYILSFLPINTCVNALTNAIGLRTGLDTLLFYGLLAGSVLLSVAIMLTKENLNPTAIVFFMAFVAVYAISAISVSNAQYMFTSVSDFATNPLYITFIYTLPAFALAMRIKDASILTEVFKFFSYFVVICSVAVYFMLPDSSATQYMSLSYNMLAQLVFLILHKPSKWKFLHYALIAAGVFVIFFGGARGATLGLLIGLALYVLFNRGNQVKKAVFLIITAVVIAFILIFLDRVVSLMQGMLAVFEIESRTFDFLLNGIKSGNDITSGRMDIYRQILSKVSIPGLGFYSDRVLLWGSYCHNLFLELLLDLGWLLGIPACLAVVLVINLGVFSRRSSLWKFVIVLIPTGFIAAMLSGSYLSQFPAIYALLGLCLNARKEHSES